MAKYVIALVDKDCGYPPIFYAKFKDGSFGTVPNRKEALVLDESVVDGYVEKAQKSMEATEIAFLGTAKYARKAVKWIVE